MTTHPTPEDREKAEKLAPYPDHDTDCSMYGHTKCICSARKDREENIEEIASALAASRLAGGEECLKAVVEEPLLSLKDTAARAAMEKMRGDQQGLREVEGL